MRFAFLYNSFKNFEIDFQKDENMRGFKLIVGSDMYKHGKPSPEPLLLGLSLLGDPDKSKAVYIGDSKQDRLSAIAAGIDWVLVDRDGSYGNEIPTIRSLDESEELA